MTTIELVNKYGESIKNFNPFVFEDEIDIVLPKTGRVIGKCIGSNIDVKTEKTFLICNFHFEIYRLYALNYSLKLIPLLDKNNKMRFCCKYRHPKPFGRDNTGNNFFYETCKICGGRITPSFDVKNGLWEKVVGKDCLDTICLSCFDILAQLKRVPYTKDDIDVFDISPYTTTSTF